MSKRQIIFIICVIWFFAWIPVGYFWGRSPVNWAERHRAGLGGAATIEQVQHAFPIHLAPLPASAITHHAAQIENEDTDPLPEFDVYDWAVRELRYRWAACFLMFVVSTVVMRWFLSLIVQGKRGWTD